MVSVADTNDCDAGHVWATGCLWWKRELHLLGRTFPPAFILLGAFSCCKLFDSCNSSSATTKRSHQRCVGKGFDIRHALSLGGYFLLYKSQTNHPSVIFKFNCKALSSMETRSVGPVDVVILVRPIGCSCFCRYLAGSAAVPPPLLAQDPVDSFVLTPPPNLLKLVNRQQSPYERKASPTSLPGRLSRALCLGTMPSLSRTGNGTISTQRRDREMDLSHTAKSYYLTFCFIVV